MTALIEAGNATMTTLLNARAESVRKGAFWINARRTDTTMNDSI